MAQGRVDSEIREREVRGLMRDLEVARDFAVQRVNRIALHVLFVVVGAIALLFLRRRAARWPEDDASVRASAAVLTRPFSCAVLIGYALTPVLYPAAPSFIYGALGVVGLVPIVRLISPLLEPDARPTFYGLVGFFIVDRVRDLITPLVTLERLLFALEMLVAIVVLGRLLRPSRLSKVTERTRLVPFAGTGLRLAVGLLIVAVGANILGSTALGLLLGEGVLVSVYGAVAVYAVYRVLAGVIGVTLRSTAARKLNMVRGHRSLILRRTLQLLRIAAVLGWFFFVSGRFNVRGDLLAAIASALSARLTIGSLSLSLSGASSPSASSSSRRCTSRACCASSWSRTSCRGCGCRAAFRTPSRRPSITRSCFWASSRPSPPRASISGSSASWRAPSAWASASASRTW
jgi:hypothetical protein